MAIKIAVNTRSSNEEAEPAGGWFFFTDSTINEVTSGSQCPQFSPSNLSLSTAWRLRHAELFGLGHMDPRALEHHLKFMWSTASMVAPDEEVTIDRTMLRGTFTHGVDTAKAIGRDVGWMPSRARTVAMPPEFVMAGRMQLGLFAVLAHLRPRANWHRILREMLDQDYSDL